MSDTTSPATTDGVAAVEPAAAKPRRRRAASRPAGPPAVDTPHDAATPEAATPDAGPAGAGTADAAATPEPVDAATVATEPAAAPRARTTRPRTRKAAAKPPADPAVVSTPAEASQTTGGPDLPAATADATVPDSAVPGDGASGDAAAGPPSAVVPAFAAPVFQEPVAATRPRRTRRTAKAQVPAPALFDDVEASRVAHAEAEAADGEAADAEAADSIDVGPAVALAAETVSDDGVARLTDDETSESADGTEQSSGDGAADDDSGAPRRRRRRGGRGRRRRQGDDDEAGPGNDAESAAAASAQDGSTDDSAGSAADGTTDGGMTDHGDDDGADADVNADGPVRRRRRRRRRGAADVDEPSADEGAATVVRVREPRARSTEITALKGSTRLEAKRQRRREGREAGRRRVPILTEAEFLARREAVDRTMVVRQADGRTQIAVLEDGVLVEHYVDAGGSSAALVGSVHLGRVQNVLPSMEAAFVDIGRGRNAVLYAGEVNWDAVGLEGQPRRIELALKSGDAVLVQVTKEPMGHKGARLTSQVSLPGRYLVYVPDGSMTGISRKLPDNERSRLKGILKRIVPDDAGVIVRTAAEGASEEELTSDVNRLAAQWAEISQKAKTAAAPALLHGEPDLAIKVVRDVFNEDFTRLVVAGAGVGDAIESYLGGVAPDLAARIERWNGDGDIFASYRVDEQLAKALDRKVWLPSGGSLVIDRTEAMTVVDVNTGKFTGQGGNLEETVTRNNIEAAEEIVRQLRLRDIGGIIVIDFIDMVLESNRELVLRRLVECLGRDRTKHQVAEVTSLGLVQMTRKRIGQGLLEVFSEPCEACHGRGVTIHLHPTAGTPATEPAAPAGKRRRGSKTVARDLGLHDPAEVAARALRGTNGADPEPADAESTPAEPTPAEGASGTAPAETAAVADEAAASAPAEPASDAASAGAATEDPTAALVAEAAAAAEPIGAEEPAAV
ncbi:MAG: ribonuclease E/G [Actinomycetota bacterium]|nr:MAG: ribonuclease E/G [Actinomycetota bacterium]